MNEQYRTHTCGELRTEHIGQQAALSGWAGTFRNHGGVIFVDLRDAFGTTQLVLHDEALLRGVTRETVIYVRGAVVARAEDTVNPKLATGLVELHVQSLVRLSAPCVPLPFEVGASENVREDVRLKYRFLDLRGERMQRNLQLRAALLQRLREHMQRFGFLEVSTPILTASSPEGARDYIVPSRKHKGAFYALPQSPQLFKQLLMVSGVDRYYQIAPCFRDEDARNDRCPGEFYQLDYELAFASQEDVLRVTEELLHDVFTTFGGGKAVTPLPFPRIPYREAMALYGSDKPDLRNPLRIGDLTEFFADAAFKPFQGKPVRGINAPGCAQQPKSFFEQMLQFATSIGMKGLGYISVVPCAEEDTGSGNTAPYPHDDAYSLKGPIVKFLDSAKQAALCAQFNLQPGDTVFFISDRPSAVDKLAGQIRSELGNRLELTDQSRFELCFITDFPMYEWDETARRVGFNHNPFSMPQGGMDALLTQDPLEILAYQFDAVVNGVELSSGAVRNHDPEIMIKAFEIAGYPQEELERRFGAMFDAFHYGAPPHAGMAPGVDRMLMLLLEEDSIRDVVAFPMNGNAQDLLMGAPGEVTESQLREVHIKVRS
ncbi:MAG: aspartate--tRNA ligase [Oscillospiraceae bacterium]|jgi:aspartyl-tRNA synthetase|nr:aspartate--tRNA ligase [Oscillospiraceae bacterium]